MGYNLSIEYNTFNKIYDNSFGLKNVKFEYLRNYPYINIFNTSELDEYKMKLIILAHIENRFFIKTEKDNKILFLRNLKYYLNQISLYIDTGTSPNILYKYCMQNSLPLIPCFLISKSIISEQSMLAFNSCDNFFKQFNQIFNSQDDEIKLWYLSYLNKYKKIIYNNPVFPISSFSSVIKYPDIIIDKKFKRFNFKKDINAISVQKPSLDILIKHIEELPDNLSCFNYLESDNFETLKLMKEMLN